MNLFRASIDTRHQNAVVANSKIKKSSPIMVSFNYKGAKK